MQMQIQQRRVDDEQWPLSGISEVFSHDGRNRGSAMILTTLFGQGTQLKVLFRLWNGQDCCKQHAAVGLFDRLHELSSDGFDVRE